MVSPHVLEEPVNKSYQTYYSSPAVILAWYFTGRQSYKESSRLVVLVYNDNVVGYNI